jgi:hypothetical protein
LNAKTISVAGFNILLESENSKDIGLEQAYLPFQIKNESGKVDLRIKAFSGIPFQLLNTNALLFEAKDSIRKYFSVYKDNNYYKFITFSQLNESKIQQIALLNNEFSEWTIYSGSSENNEEMFPLLYPMGPLIFYYLTLKYEAIMIHASGLFDGERGRIFTGFSGSGKSTMAGLWQKTGSEILNDDRLIIRKEREGYFMYNTPMFYSDTPKKGPFHFLYVIGHSKENKLNRLEGAKAVSSVMAFCIQHGYNMHFIEQHLDFLSELCLHIPIYDLGFVPDENVIDFIKTHGS